MKTDEKSVLKGKSHYAANLECGYGWIHCNIDTTQCAITWAQRSFWMSSSSWEKFD